MKLSFYGAEQALYHLKIATEGWSPFMQVRKTMDYCDIFQEN